jgi:hypothetical protein
MKPASLLFQQKSRVKSQDLRQSFPEGAIAPESARVTVQASSGLNPASWNRQTRPLLK